MQEICSEPAVPSKPSISCEYCGEELDEEQSANPRKDDVGDVMCDECFHDHYEFECYHCGNYEEEEHKGDIIVIGEACGGLESGVYKIIRRPFFISNYFDMWWIKESLTKVRTLPDDFTLCDDHYPSGFLCWPCQQVFGESAQ